MTAASDVISSDVLPFFPPLISRVRGLPRCPRGWGCATWLAISTGVSPPIPLCGRSWLSSCFMKDSSSDWRSFREYVTLVTGTFAELYFLDPLVIRAD